VRKEAGGHVEDNKKEDRTKERERKEGKTPLQSDGTSHNHLKIDCALSYKNIRTGTGKKLKLPQANRGIGEHGAGGRSTSVGQGSQGIS